MEGSQCFSFLYTFCRIAQFEEVLSQDVVDIKKLQRLCSHGNLSLLYLCLKQLLQGICCVIFNSLSDAVHYHTAACSCPQTKDTGAHLDVCSYLYVRMLSPSGCPDVKGIRQLCWKVCGLSAQACILKSSSTYNSALQRRLSVCSYSFCYTTSHVRKLSGGRPSHLKGRVHCAVVFTPTASDICMISTLLRVTEQLTVKVIHLHVVDSAVSL